MFQIVKSSPKPLGDQLVDEMSRLIETGRLSEGSRLPSVRDLARRAGVSPYTVTTTFERLQALGLIEPRRGSGHFVARRRKPPVTAAVELGPPPNPDPAVGFALTAFASSDGVVPAGSGVLPSGWFEEAIPAATYAKVRRAAAAAVTAPPQGDPSLRELLVERLHRRAVPATAANIVVTMGATHGFELLARSLLAPGDTVFVDDPGYFVLPTQLKAHRLNVVPVPKCADGTDLASLEELARQHRPRMFFTQTLLHNPTGLSSSAANCHGILKLADKFDFLVAEDHIFSDLGASTLVSLAQIDELRRVFYVGSFTKVLCPGVRIGFLAAPAAYVPGIVEQKVLTVLCGSALDECLLREVLAGGKYRKHLERLRDRLAKARGRSADVLRGAGLAIDSAPSDGWFLWARLPESVEATQLVAKARKGGILLAHGSLFSLTGGSQSYLRFNAAYADDPRLLQFLEEHCGVECLTT